MVKNEWINWTLKSKEVSYKKITNGVGKGEYKVASELDTTVLGQNSPYDMYIKLEDGSYPADIKQLDRNTFNTGKIGRDKLRPIKKNIESFINLIDCISDNKFFTIDEYKQLLFFKNISSDEISVGTFKKLNQTIQMLHKKRTLLSTRTIIDPFEGNSIEVSLDKYYTLCKLFEKSFCKDEMDLMGLLNHPYICDSNLLEKEIKELKNIFEGIILIFVDEYKGYMIIKNPIECINFERITRGTPRFRYVPP